MSPTAEQLGDELASRIVQEAVEEVRGRSSRKWAVALVALLLGAAIALVALLLGAAIALVVVQRRAHQVAADDRDQVSPPLSPSTA